MPLTIDEVTAEIAPPNPPNPHPQSSTSSSPNPEARRQLQDEMQALIRQRSERLRAD